MPQQKQFPTGPIFIALIIHVFVIALLLISFQLPAKTFQAAYDPINIVQAQLVDGAAIAAEKKRIADEQAALERQRQQLALQKKRAEEEKLRQQLAAKKRLEQQRLAAIEKAQQEQKKAEQARLRAEQARKEAEQAKRLAQQQAELERKRAEENERKLAAALKQQEEAKKKAELAAEQKRLDAILAEEEAEIRAAEEAARRAARQRQLDTMLVQYIGAITNKIQSRWRQPSGMETGQVYCIVYVEQSVGGYIQKVSVQKCQGGDEQLRISVEEAVWKSDPLPTPPDDELFQRQLKITFEPK